MKSNDESSSSGSSNSGSLGGGSNSPTYKFVNFKKPPRNIVITDSGINDQRLAKQKRRQQITENEREQQRFDLDVILSGFPVKPNVKVVVEKFLDLLNVPKDSVRTYYQFENRTKQDTFHHIVITFKNKQGQTRLLNGKAALRKPIRWYQLSEFKQDEDIIMCKSRFSKFNSSVNKQLLELKVNNIIMEYKFENLFFSYKQTPVSTWKIVSVMDDLIHLNDLLKYVPRRNPPKKIL